MQKASLGSFCLAVVLELGLAYGRPGCAEPALGSSSEPVLREAARAAFAEPCTGTGPDGEVTGGSPTAAPLRAAPRPGA
jgi:hypothetical protein